jgi:hypothetical protein
MPTGSASTATLAVVVPVYRPDLSADERLTLRQLEHYLPAAEKHLLMPEGLSFHRPGYHEARFAPAFFADLRGYNRLMLDDRLYAHFDRYEYILIHQLDALVLSPDIGRFLDLGVDYLGAPWIDYGPDGAPRLARVGNGGLSLRRVSAFRRLLSSHISARQYYRHAYEGSSRLVGLLKAGLKGLGVRSAIGRDILDSLGNEDEFIAERATVYDRGFRIGDLPQALAFAFEREPRFCFAEAGGRLPWGVHAWEKYDRGFWEPHIV